MQKVILYKEGVGTLDGFENLSIGVFGAGVDRNIRDLCIAFALKHARDNEMYSFGFSRIATPSAPSQR